MADSFNELIHRLRGELLSEMPAAEVVISAGCSGSWYFDWFEQRYPHPIVRHIGFEIEPPPDQLPANVEWHQSSFADMSPVADNSVDLIFAGQAIEHVSITECYSFLKDAQRVLKHSGVLVMDSPNFTVTGPSGYRHPEHIIEYTTEQMQTILQTAGFRVAKFQGILVCRENGVLLSDPYNYEQIGEERIKQAREKPEDSFIWWIEAERVSRFDASRLKDLLYEIDRSHKQKLAEFDRADSEKSVQLAARPLEERSEYTEQIEHTKAEVPVVSSTIKPGLAHTLRRASEYRRLYGWNEFLTRLIRPWLWVPIMLRSPQSASTPLMQSGGGEIVSLKTSPSGLMDVILPRLDKMQELIARGPDMIETQSEIMDLILRRLGRIEGEVTAQVTTLEASKAARLGTMEGDLATRLSMLEGQIAIVSEPPSNELSARTAQILNYDQSYLGFRHHFGVFINYPVSIAYSPDEVQWSSTNERVIEIPFTFQALAQLSPPARIIDIGAAESLVSLELASLGYKVTAIDIRPYAFSHPNLTTVVADIVDWEGPKEPYDAAILLSTIEHIGLPVYGISSLEAEKDEHAMAKVRSLLRPGGLLILTTPFGQSQVTPTERIYSAEDVKRLLNGFQVLQCAVTKQLDDKTWLVDKEVTLNTASLQEESDGQHKVIMIVAQRM